MKYRFTILLTWLITNFIAASGQQLSFIKYTVYDGLVANPVRCIYQDSKGFIWIGTYDGLSRYDGYKFTNYTSMNGLSHNLVNSILETDGKLLIAENNGAIDVIENNITIKKTHKIPSPANSIGVHNNRLLITTDFEGFYEFKNDSAVSIPKSRNISSFGHIISLNDSVFLCSGVEDDLFLLKNDFTILSTINIPGVLVYNFLKDSKKRIWACTSSGLKLIQVKMGVSPQMSIIPLPEPFNIPTLNNAQLTSMIEAQDGSFWFGTSTGLAHLMPGGKLRVYDEKDGLPSARILYLLLDKEKNIWIGTSLGLAKWVSKNNVTFYNTETKHQNFDVFTNTSADVHRIILATNHGYWDFNLKTGESKQINFPGYPQPDLIAGTSPLRIHYADKIGMLDSKTNSVVTIEKLDTVIGGNIATLKHPDETIFMVTFNGLYAAYKKTVKKILPYRFTSIALDYKGHIWAGTWTEGLFRITIKNSSELLYDTHDMTARVKGQKQIRGLYVDSKGNIWTGTRYGGAFCLSPKVNNDFEIQHFNRQSGLMSDWVTCFAETKTGDMWVGNYLGIDKLVKTASGYRVFNFSKAVNFFAEMRKIIQVADQWIGLAASGTALFKDEGLHKEAPLQPIIFSSSLGVLENKITIFSPSNKISVKPKQNAARFEFGALGFINERQIIYSYRLKGSSDTSWSKPDNVHEASYASLSPGEYRFEVKTLGWNGEYSAPATFSFFISTPFWKQGWFIILCIVLAALLFYLLYNYRIQQLLRLQKVRNIIATDLHDEIGSTLTNISILAELSRKKNQSSEFSKKLPQRIAEESNQAQQALDDIIWSINSNNDTLTQTTARMRRYAAQVFEPIGVNCHFDFANIAGDAKLNMEQRKDIYLVFKECLNNIIKHAHAKNVFILIVSGKNEFHLTIRDDGKGFDALKQTDRNGVKNIRSRIQRWNGNLVFSSAVGEGTSVKCGFPLVSPK